MSDKIVLSVWYGEKKEISELMFKRLLLLAKYNRNSKSWYHYYYFMSQYVEWTLGTAFLRPAGEAKLQELLNKKC